MQVHQLLHCNDGHGHDGHHIGELGSLKAVCCLNAEWKWRRRLWVGGIDHNDIGMKEAGG